MKRFVVMLIMALAVLVSEKSSAVPFVLQVDDDGIAANQFVFPGWGGVTGAGSDPYGTPDFNSFDKGATPASVKYAMRIDGTKDAVTGDRYLNKVTFHYWDPYQTGANPSGTISGLFPGDLFIDMSTGPVSDQKWDYVVSLGAFTFANRSGVNKAGTVYQLTTPLGYADGGTSNGNPNYEQAVGSGHRTYHPTAVEQQLLTNPIATATFTGWAIAANSYPDINYQTVVGNQVVPKVYWSSFNFSGTGLKLPAGEMYLGFTVNCANDVVYGAAGLPSDRPIPEPGTVLLLGTGLLGLATVMRRRSGAL